ncbi:MAG: hypothetical protein ACI8VI_001329, partial [Granulosicoccus sp.]
SFNHLIGFANAFTNKRFDDTFIKMVHSIPIDTCYRVKPA